MGRDAEKSNPLRFQGLVNHAYCLGLDYAGHQDISGRNHMPVRCKKSLSGIVEGGNGFSEKRKHAADVRDNQVNALWQIRAAGITLQKPNFLTDSVRCSNLAFRHTPLTVSGKAGPL